MPLTERDTKLVSTYDLVCDRCGRTAELLSTAPDDGVVPAGEPILPGGWRNAWNPAWSEYAQRVLFCSRPCMSVFLAEVVATQYQDEVVSPKRLRRPPTTSMELDAASG